MNQIFYGTSVHEASCLERYVHGVSYPRGKLFTGRVVHEASCLRSGSSMERVDYGTNYPWHGAMCHGVSCDGREMLWGKLPCGEKSCGKITKGHVVRQ